MNPNRLFVLLVLISGCSVSNLESTSFDAATQAFSQSSKLPLPTETSDPAQGVEYFPLDKSVLPDLGPAPELENEVWLNTSQPLNLKELRGKVVLLEMWTFG